MENDAVSHTTVGMRPHLLCYEAIPVPTAADFTSVCAGV